MTRSELIEINSALRDAVDDIEDVLNLLERPAQSSLTVDGLEVDNAYMEQALSAIRDFATSALADIAGDDDNGDHDDDEGDE